MFRIRRITTHMLIWLTALAINVSTWPAGSCGCVAGAKSCCSTAASTHDCCCSPQTIREGRCCCCSERDTAEQPAAPSCCSDSQEHGSKDDEGSCPCGSGCRCHGSQPTLPALPSSAETQSENVLSPPVSNRDSEELGPFTGPRDPRGEARVMFTETAASRCVLLCRFVL